MSTWRDDGASRGSSPMAGMTLGVTVLFAVLLPLALAFFTGSISIPHNDAWAYSKITEHFAETGHIRLQGWNRSSLIGLVVILGPLGRSLIIQHVFVAILAAGSIVLTFALLRPMVGPRRAAAAAAIVAIWPGFGLLSTSYMADIPAFFACLASLRAGQLAIERSSLRWMGAALLLGMWGVSIREQALAAPVAVIVAGMIAAKDGERRRKILVLAATFIAAALEFELWRRGMANSDSGSYSLRLLSALKNALKVGLQVYFTLALFLAPAVFYRASRLAWRRIHLMTVLLLGPLIGAAAWLLSPRLILGNYLDPKGSYAAASIGQRTVLPHGVLLLLAAVALGSALVTPPVLLSAWHRLDPLLASYAGFLALGTLAEAALVQGVFARYLLPLLPAVLGILLSSREDDRRSRLPARSLAIAVFVFLAATTTALNANALSFDAARWRAAQSVQAQGAAANQIDAGLEWTGYHSLSPFEPGADANPGAYGWWMSHFPSSRECLIITSSAFPGLTTLAVPTYRTWALFGSSSLWVQQTNEC